MLAWAGVAVWLWRERERVPPETWQHWRWQLLLSAGYVAGCAWRSMMPVYDVPRLVLVDSFWSSVIVGRSVATLAELCFAAQWALLLRALSRMAACSTALAVSRLLLPLIAVAELFSWYSVLTTSNAGHVVEETLWGLCALLLVLACAALWPRIDRGQRPLLGAAGAAALAYAAYMFGGRADGPASVRRLAAAHGLGQRQVVAQRRRPAPGRFGQVVPAPEGHRLRRVGQGLEQPQLVGRHGAALQPQRVRRRRRQARRIACIDAHQVALGLHMQADRLDHIGAEVPGQQPQRAQFVHIVDRVAARCRRDEVADVVQQRRHHHSVRRLGPLGELRALQRVRERGDGLLAQPRVGGVAVQMEQLGDLVEHVHRRRGIEVHVASIGTAHRRAHR
jgi:hypothetical protein